MKLPLAFDVAHYNSCCDSFLTTKFYNLLLGKGQSEMVFS